MIVHLFLMTMLLSLVCPCQAFSNEQSLVATPAITEYYVDHLSTDDSGAYPKVSIFLSNGAHFVFQSDQFSDYGLYHLFEELQPGKRVYFMCYNTDRGIRIRPEGGGFEYHVAVGRGAKEYFPKIIDILDDSGWFSTNYKIYLSDGSIWDTSSKWRIGDTVMYDGYSRTTFLINLDVGRNDRLTMVSRASGSCSK